MHKSVRQKSFMVGLSLLKVAPMRYRKNMMSVSETISSLGTNVSVSGLIWKRLEVT